jgi:protein TonB
MASYACTATRPDRARAILGVIAVHAALAFIILSGLNVRAVKEAVEQLTTINIVEPPPLPPIQPPPPHAKQARAMKKPEGAAAKEAEPSPIVAPEPKLPLPSPIPAAKIAGNGNAPTSGAALAGNGTGAGAGGNGPGGGGDFSRFTPARRISKIPDREYRMLASSGLRSGSVGVTVRVNTDGAVSNCRIARSSGNAFADDLMCQLTLRYIRFEPARDPSGSPVSQDVTFVPNWWKP